MHKLIFEESILSRMEIANYITEIKSSTISLFLLLGLGQLVDKNTAEKIDYISSPLICQETLNADFGGMSHILEKIYIANMKKSVEEHTVVTEDGYILTIHRMLSSPDSNKSILIQHGVVVNSMSWLIPTGKSLASIVAGEGYDVWLGNVRGNNYGRKHLNLSLSDPQFWNFTFHEFGSYDLPAIIDYIKMVKHDENITIDYIGHSMGVSSLSAMASQRPDYMKNIRSVIALAPAVYLNNVRGLSRYVAQFRKQIKALADFFGIQTFSSRGWFLDNIAVNICTIPLFRDTICVNLPFWICGWNPRQLDYKLIPMLWSIAPDGASMKLLDHGLQQIKNVEFQQYDYGSEGNQMIYGRSTPPLYNLSKIDVPVAVFYSDNDYLVHPKDALKFYENVERKMGAYRVKDDNFNHIDFMWAKNAPKLVFKRILKLLRSLD